MKIIKDKRLTYLVTLDQIYQKMGYKTEIDCFKGILKIGSKKEGSSHDNSKGFFEGISK